MRKRIARAVGAVLLATSWLAIDVDQAAAEPQINMLHQWYRGSDAAAIAKHAHKKGMTLREAGLDLDLVDEETFDRVVRPESMLGR